MSSFFKIAVFKVFYKLFFPYLSYYFFVYFQGKNDVFYLFYLFSFFVLIFPSLTASGSYSISYTCVKDAHPPSPRLVIHIYRYTVGLAC